MSAIKTWQERLPAPFQRKCCTMNCSLPAGDPRTKHDVMADCPDCDWATVLGDDRAARDAEIAELRGALDAACYEVAGLQPDAWRFAAIRRSMTEEGYEEGYNVTDYIHDGLELHRLADRLPTKAEWNAIVDRAIAKADAEMARKTAADGEKVASYVPAHHPV